MQLFASLPLWVGCSELSCHISWARHSQSGLRVQEAQQICLLHAASNIGSRLCWSTLSLARSAAKPLYARSDLASAACLQT